MKKTDKVLVTGASGFIGSHLLRLLYQKGYTNLRSTSFSRDLRNDFDGTLEVEHIKGDLQNAEFCELISKDVDVVFHCAANTSNALDTKFNPLLHVTPNVEMNVNLMEQSWKNKVRKFLFISSNTTYPDMGNEFCTEDMNVHATPMLPVYKAVGGMKRYGEMLCDFFSNQIHEPMQCLIVRPSNAFGPNDKFDFEKCHVTTANIRKVAYGNTNPIEYVNNKAPMIPIRLLSSKKINDLGWKPKRNLKEALKETIEWYKANKHQYNSNSKP